MNQPNEPAFRVVEDPQEQQMARDLPTRGTLGAVVKSLLDGNMVFIEGAEAFARKCNALSNKNSAVRKAGYAVRRRRVGDGGYVWLEQRT